MVEAASNGLLRGRPFGGVAFLWNPAAVKKVSVVGAGPAGRCAAIKLVVDKYVILVYLVYLPCFEDSFEYSHNLHECLGYIESLLVNESYSDVIICDDFNFSCNGHNFGYRPLLMNIMTDFNLSHCDDLICNNVHESYVNVALGHASLIDHFIVSARLRQLIINCEILVSPDNFSDHRPVS